MNNANLWPMRAIQLIILLLITGWCLPPVYASGNDAGAFAMAPLATDEIIAPNVFTPNGDDKNDVFEVVSKEGNPVILKIFTRTGVLIFSSEAKRCRWDGRSLSGEEMANGVYYYTAEVPGSSPKVFKSGFVHLFR